MGQERIQIYKKKKMQKFRFLDVSWMTEELTSVSQNIQIMNKRLKNIIIVVLIRLLFLCCVNKGLAFVSVSVRKPDGWVKPPHQGSQLQAVHKMICPWISVKSKFLFRNTVIHCVI